MKVSLQTAMEVFGLNNDYTEGEVKKSFRELSKLTHPDVGGNTNLFSFVQSCKEVLMNGENNNFETDNKEYATEASSSFEKEKRNVELFFLYEEYYNFFKYTSKYDIANIHSKVIVNIIPRRNKSINEKFVLDLSQIYSDYLKLGFANFETMIKLPEKLKKYKRFKVKVKFMGTKYEFKLSMWKPYHMIEYDMRSAFISHLELKFK